MKNKVSVLSSKIHVDLSFLQGDCKVGWIVPQAENKQFWNTCRLKGLSLLSCEIRQGKVKLNMGIPLLTYRTDEQSDSH